MRYKASMLKRGSMRLGDKDTNRYLSRFQDYAPMGSVIEHGEFVDGKKNDVKARSLLLMALPNEHQLTFDQYVDAQSMFAAIKARFGGNEATKKTQKALLKQQYENFNVSSSESLDIVSLTGFKSMLVMQFWVRSQIVHEDLEQLHDDDLEEMDLKWNMALLSMRARKFYQRTGRKIIIDGSITAGYDKSKVEYFNCHKIGHFAKECRAPRSKDNINWNQGSSSKAVKIEDASKKAMCAIDGAGFDWSDMAEEEKYKETMALMAFYRYYTKINLVSNLP
ncbi:ribonuclease H-like domain-containing protein [Tanacetum coccineum]